MSSSFGIGAYPAARWPAPGRARVLLVLEQPALVELTQLTLNHGGYSTHAAHSAAEVETTVAEWRPQLLILDMDLAGMQIIAPVNRGMLASIPTLNITGNLGSTPPP